MLRLTSTSSPRSDCKLMVIWECHPPVFVLCFAGVSCLRGWCMVAHVPDPAPPIIGCRGEPPVVPCCEGLINQHCTYINYHTLTLTHTHTCPHTRNQGKHSWKISGTTTVVPVIISMSRSPWNHNVINQNESLNKLKNIPWMSSS